MKPIPALATVAVGPVSHPTPSTSTQAGITGYVDPVIGVAVRLPWLATFTLGQLREGWLSGPLVDVWTARGQRVPAELVRVIERVARNATSGDNLPRVEVHPDAAYTAEQAKPPNVIVLGPRKQSLLDTAPLPGRSTPDRRNPDAD